MAAKSPNLPTSVMPLTSATTSKRDLATVNSIFIAGIQGEHAQTLNAIIYDIARNELSCSVVVPKTPGDCSRAAGADACLVVDIISYDERSGSSIGVTDSSAIVSFNVRLRRFEDSRDIWVGRYSFSDTPLSDDIIRFGSNVAQKGGKATFTTARAQFEKGFRDAVRRLNDDRTRQFLK